jgi:hypothetical protein
MKTGTSKSAILTETLNQTPMGWSDYFNATEKEEYKYKDAY